MANNITASTTSSRISVSASDGKTKVITATPIAINGAAGPPGASGDVASQTTLIQLEAGVSHINNQFNGFISLFNTGIVGRNW